MAIKVSEKKYKGSAEWMQVALQLIKDEGMDNERLEEFVQTEWLEPMKDLHELIERVGTYMPQMKEMMGAITKEGVDPLVQAFRRMNVDSYLLEHVLYFNMVSENFTLQPIPTETTLVFRETINTLKYPVCLAYIQEPNQKNEGRVVDFILHYLQRQIEHSIQHAMVRDVSEYEPYQKRDLMYSYAKGELLIGDITLNPQSAEYLSGHLSAQLACHHYYHPKESARDIIFPIILETKASLVFLHEILNYTYASISSLYEEEVVKTFFDYWGIETIANQYFYTPRSSGKRRLKTSQDLPEIEEVLDYLTDDIYEELLKIHLQIMSGYKVDTLTASKDRDEYLYTLTCLLADERSKPLIEQWGGVYNNQVYSAYYMTTLVYDKEITQANFLQTHRMKVFHYEEMSNEPRVYIDDAEYEGITQLMKELTTLPLIETQRIQLLKSFYLFLHPVSELNELLKGTGLVVEDFTDTYEFDSDSLEEVIFCPYFNQGRRVDVTTPIPDCEVLEK